MTAAVTQIAGRPIPAIPPPDTLGIGLYGLTYLYPLYLAEIRGYDARMIGETVFVSGLAMFLTAPIAGRLTTKVDPRFMLAAGFLSFAVGSWLMTYITSDWDFGSWSGRRSAAASGSWRRSSRSTMWRSGRCLPIG